MSSEAQYSLADFYFTDTDDPAQRQCLHVAERRIQTP